MEKEKMPEENILEEVAGGYMVRSYRPFSVGRDQQPAQYDFLYLNKDEYNLLKKAGYISNGKLMDSVDGEKLKKIISSLKSKGSVIQKGDEYIPAINIKH